jgi:hypothetical protein
VDGGLDPRPAVEGPAYTNEKLAPPVGNSFLTAVEYIGAFGENLWIKDWTFLAFSNFVSVQQRTVAADEGTSINAFPNPFTESTHIDFSIETNFNVKIDVYNTLGSKVATLVNKHLGAGSYTVDWTPGNIAKGMYIIVMETPDGVVTQKVVLR